MVLSGYFRLQRSAVLCDSATRDLLSALLDTEKAVAMFSELFFRDLKRDFESSGLNTKQFATADRFEACSDELALVERRLAHGVRRWQQVQDELRAEFGPRSQRTQQAAALLDATAGRP
eukprot:TRINITY_DN2853_c0_g1_i1.p2 TRINITY_DN2853_c0_g1~~TRINITY_DN2853_c0_g1_i1.p2  ORF type:complete len:119 (+),score=22.15 TRINITY_DN2853_c0_g1_i1:131-487(+)